MTRLTSISAAAALLSTLAFAAGCDCAGTSTTSVPCATAAECPGDQFCIGGTCQAPGGECTSAAQCGPGAECVDRRCRRLGGSGDAGRGDGALSDGGDNMLCFDLDGDGTSGRSTRCPSGTDCDDNNRAVRPGGAEQCMNGVDDDCDGTMDEPDCTCAAGTIMSCYTGAAGTVNVGVCRPGQTNCGSSATSCEGQILPDDESCNSLDDDCDGMTDEGLRNACGECSPTTPAEMCGNDLDDDCDGKTDEGASCSCDYRCQFPPADPRCKPPTNQPCYEGPVGTQGVGACRGGRRDCSGPPTNQWGMCAGQILPGTECMGGATNAIDDDCDGRVDEGCLDADGDGTPFPIDCDDSDATIEPGAAESCDGGDNDCDRVVDEGVSNLCGGCGALPATDDCTNSLDDDCDGRINEDCECPGAGMTQSCYGGPASTRGQGICADGTQTCQGVEFLRWTDCTGWVSPRTEVCGNTDDEDCDGAIDERYAIGSNACGYCDSTDSCMNGDGVDNDCDGLIDEEGDCPPPAETCNTMDDDRDGKVDEGVVNACGTCPPTPCFTEEWPDPWADCQGANPPASCDSVEEDPDMPGSITLGESMFNFDFIYIASTSVDRVAQLDTDTGVRNWLVSSHGEDPSRTAVARDGSVWVGNRCLAGLSNASADDSFTCSNAVHLDRGDGHLICRADVPGMVRGLAIDGAGNVWAGTWNGRTLYRISGTEVDATMNPPRCRILNQYDVGVNIYGVTVDPDGYVWTASSPTIRLNTANGQFQQVTNPAYYGIAPDAQGRIWHGDWNGRGPVHAIRRSDFMVINVPGATRVTGVTVHPMDGSIWGTRHDANEIIGIDGTSLAVRCTGAMPNGGRPHGVAVDRMGRLWAPQRTGGRAQVFDINCNHLNTYDVDVGQELYSYSDMTGHLLRTITAPEGSWSTVFDSGYAQAYWDEVTWTGFLPANTSIEVTVRAADTVAALSSAASCGPFPTMGPRGTAMAPATIAVDLAGCMPALGRHRYLEVSFRLASTMTGVRPRLDEADASWAY